MHRSPVRALEAELEEVSQRLLVLIAALQGMGFEVEELVEALTTMQEYFDGFP